MNNLKKNFILLASFFLCQYNYAQQLNTITTAVPFLGINPNAQSMGIADIGVVASSEYYESGVTQNPALLSRNEKVIGGKISYKPWLSFLIADIRMLDAGFYYAFSNKNSLAYSFNLFSLGEVDFTNVTRNMARQYRPHEFCHNLKYARSLNSNLSLGLGLKFIQSDLTNNIMVLGRETHVGKAIAGDIGFDYRKEVAKKETSFWRYDIGASILNMGNKVRYVDGSDGSFLPMLISAGTMWTYTKEISPDLKYCIDLAYQGEKLLVPTPQISANNQGNWISYSSNLSVFQGAYNSFSDAPGGAKEEFSEIVHKIGVENRVIINDNTRVALRGGYFHESPQKGNRNYFNIGIGAKTHDVYIDAGMIFFYKWGNNWVRPSFDMPYSWDLTVGYMHSFK